MIKHENIVKVSNIFVYTPDSSPQQVSQSGNEAGNTSSDKSKNEKSVIISKILPSDRFWVTCFEDLDNNMEAGEMQQCCFLIFT